MVKAAAKMKTRMLHVRVSFADLRMLTTLAAAEARTPSDCVRRYIHEQYDRLAKEREAAKPGK